MRLDPDELREYAARDWGAPERLARPQRAHQPTEKKVQLAVELYEAARRHNPSWPTDEDRQKDLASHQRVSSLLRRAAHVGTR